MSQVNDAVVNMNLQKQMRSATREANAANGRLDEMLARLEVVVERAEAVADALEAKRGPGRPRKAEIAGAA